MSAVDSSGLTPLESENFISTSTDFINYLLDSTPAGISVIDRDYRLVRVNRAMINLLQGVTSLIYQTNDVLVKDEMPEVMKMRWRDVIDRCFNGESQAYNVSYPIAGRTHHFETTLRPYIVSDRVIYVINTSNDITDALDKQNAVDQTERRFKALIERSTDIKAMLDEEGRVTYRSPASERILGHADQEMIGRSAFRNIHPDDLAITLSAFQQAKLKPGEPVLVEFRMFNKAGEQVALEGSVVNLLDIPEVQAMVVNARDITVRRRLEHEREKMANELAQRVKELEQFTYIVSHNLRAPVANMLGISNVMKVGNPDDALREQLFDGMHDAAVRLDDVLKDLNNMLSVKQEMNEKKETVQMSKLVHDIESDLRDLIREKRVELVCDFSATDTFITLKSYLHSIFYNLIANAIKYSHPDRVPRISVSSALVGDKVNLLFEDNGLGIDLATKKDQVFGLYKRFHTHVDGKGIGLFMVKTQVQTLGGTISIESKVNEGTRFKIVFDA